MKRLIALSALVATIASAQSIPQDAAKLTWVNAVQLADGNPIPATGDLSLFQTRIQRSITANCVTGPFGTVEQVVNVTPAELTMTFSNLKPAGIHCFRIAHVQVNGTVSAWSAVVGKNIIVDTRSKPPTVTIQ